MTAILLATFLALLALGAPGRGRGLLALRDLTRTLFASRIVVPTVVVLALVAVLGRRYLDVTAYAERVAVTSVGFLALYVLADRLEWGSSRIVAWCDRRTLPQLLLAGSIASLLAGWRLLDFFPHVSDEVAYLFQAKAMSQGALSFPAPDPAGSFVFIHTMVEHGRWFGIMNPGWPALLALGEAMRAPWLINPLLGALALWLFNGFFREAGFTSRTRRLALLLLAVSPFLLFMNGTFMAHPANLALFGAFCWSWARLLRTESRRDAVLAGLALGLNLLVRPIDAVAVSLPFAVQGLLRLRRNPRLLPLFAITTIVASGGVLLTLLYNRALTGDAMVMPMSRYFELRNPLERFGMGFGADMGTKIHGDEWPGFYPADAVAVSSYRLAQLFLDLFGLPILPVAALALAVVRRRDWDEWFTVLLGTIASLVGVYFFHFYHGIAYGSRHLYLAAPALALAMARPAADWLERGTPEVTRRGRAVVVALLAFTLLFAYPPLCHEYGRLYRNVDGRVRDAGSVTKLTNALVFVDEARWGWKFTFPLNDYPLEANRVLFVRDSAALNPRVAERFPGRQSYRLTIERDGGVTLTPLAGP
ncbi:MAG: hypothetical protein JNM53_03375 [Gemmatimonadetes bacterium]|nr:hypothetical protein [Gemmatimonadota bacterium]